MEGAHQILEEAPPGINESEACYWFNSFTKNT